MNIFIPSSPEKLVVLAEQKLKTAKAGVAASKKIAAALRSTGSRDALTSAKILIFEGKKAVDQMLYDRCEEWRRSTIQVKRPWVGFQDASFAQNYAHWIVDYWKRFNQYKDWRQDSVRLFSQEGAVEVKLSPNASELAEGRREIKALPSGFPFSASLWVVGEYIVLLHTRTEPPYALQIRDQILADNLAATFEFMWTLVS